MRRTRSTKGKDDAALPRLGRCRHHARRHAAKTAFQFAGSGFDTRIPGDGRRDDDRARMGGDGGGTRRRQRAIAEPQIIAVLSLRRNRAGG